MFKVDLLPAAHGDCIWIEYGNARKRRFILIDGGPDSTWRTALREHIHQFNEVELLVLTHIDADHIAGAIPLLKHVEKGMFRDVWFNGWQHLSPDGFLSAKQGEIFSTLITDRGDPWNKAFDDKAACVTEDRMPVIKLPGGMKLTILSPTPKELARLKRKWSAQLKKHGLKPGAHAQYRQFLARSPNTSTDVAELAATKFKSDRSAPNAASIAFLAEFNRKAVLFTGDAVASVLCRTIRTLLAERGQDKLKIAALKVPHHGSRGNINTDLLDLLDCKQFWFSSNGDMHNLPDNEAVGRILHSTTGKVQLVFNYKCERTNTWNAPDLKRKYGYTTTYGVDGWVSIELAK